MRKIVPDADHKNPYYIVAAKYNRQSAGVKALHFLCHHLNKAGYPAYILNISGMPLFDEDGGYINPDYITPLLTQETFLIHKQSGKNPITVYPDSVRGNPLRSSCIARYLLHYPGHLGGDKEESFDKNDLIFSYSRKIKESLKRQKTETLFMPICNTDLFNEEGATKNRSGSCFYASKYQDYHGGELMDITKDSVEITRSRPDSQTPEEIAKLLKQSEVFYSYEDTSLATEAILCGCPVVFVKNKHFQEKVSIATHEIGSKGTRFSDEDFDLDTLKAEIPEAQSKYYESVDNFWPALDNFIEKTQLHSLKMTRSSKLRMSKKVPIGRKIRVFFKSLIAKLFKSSC